jgi:hypothetical protein
MPSSKIILDLNLAALIGGHLIESPKSGKPAFYLDIEHSNAKPRMDPRAKRKPELWLRIEAIQSDNMRNENTHFVVEPAAAGERNPLIGAARLFIFNEPTHRQTVAATSTKGIDS